MKLTNRSLLSRLGFYRNSRQMFFAGGRSILTASIVVLIAWRVSRSQAASGTWLNTGASDGNWTTTSNWVGGTVPGSTVAITGTNNNGDTATFNTAVGTFGTSGNPIVIDSASENIKSITFDTVSVGSFFIGATNLNSLFVTSGGAISLTNTAITATETINAPIVIEGASGTYSFTNNSTSTGLLNFGGQISGGNASAQTLNINGSNAGSNTISGNIVNGTATSLAVTKSGNGQWVLAGSGNSYTGTTTVSAGTLTLTGSLTGSGSNILVTGGTFSETSTGVIATGVGTFTQTGGNSTLQGANTYTGATAVSGGGTFVVSGASGTINGSATINITGTGTLGGTNGSSYLQLDNTLGTLERIKDTAAINLSSGAEFRLTQGNITSGVTETVGAINFGTGMNMITINGANTVLTQIAAASITRSNLGTGVVRGTSLGNNPTNAGRITLVTAPTGADFVGTNTASTSSGGSTTKNLKIVPWLVGDTLTGAGNFGGAFVTYDSGGSGLRPLVANEQSALTNAYTAASENVVSSTAGALTAAAGNRQFNSLWFTAATALTAGNSADTLTIDSGAIAGYGSAVSIGGFSKINLDNGEGIISPADGAANTITINSAIDVTSGGAHSAGGGLTKGGMGVLVLGASNLYTGQTTVNQGTLQIGTGTAGDLGSNTANIVLNGGNLSFGRTNSGLTLSNNISGTGSVTQNGAGGTTVLSGNITYTGTTTVTAGTLSYTGTGSNLGQFIVNSGGTNSVINFASGAGAYAYNNVNVLVGNNATGAGVVNQSAGTVSGINQLQIGAVTGGSYGYYRLSGGTLGIAELDLGGFNGAPSGVMDISGGTLNASSWLIVSRGSGGTGLLNMTGGAVNFTGGTANQLVMNFNANATEAAVINVANANFTAASASGGILDMMKSGSAGQRGTVNLLSGGVMQVQGIKASNATGTSNFNFNGGTLKASTANASFLTGLTAATVYSGGGTINNNGVAITVGQVLAAPAGFGVSSSTVSVPSGGSGYIGAPIVTLSGGTGTGATGYATISGGVVTGIVITSPGTGYTSGDTLTATFTGGGATVAASTVTGITVASNTGGAMTFLGSGTTTLTNSNTYTGNTTIAMGNTTGLNNAATLNLSFAANQTNIINNTSNSSALILGGSLTSNATTVLGGGQLTLTGVATSTNTQRFNGLTVGTGGNNIVFVNNATANTIAVDVGAITRNVGGALHITQPTGTVSSSNGVQTSTGTASTILTDANGTAFATVGTSTPTTAQAGDWAAKDATNTFIVGGSTISGFYTTSTTAGTFSGNADVTTGFTATAGTTVNSIRMNNNTAQTLNINSSGNTTVNTGGILFGSTGNSVITGSGTAKLVAGAGKELVFINTSTGTPQINAVIGDSASGASSVTYRALQLTSGNGQFAIGGAGNTYTGNTYIETGRVATNVSTAFGTGTGTGGNVYINGNTNGQAYLTGGTFANHFYLIGNGWNEGSGPFGALRLQGATISGQVTLLGNATISDQGGTGTINGVIDDGGSAYALTVNGSGTLILTNANTYTGATTISAGTLQLGNSSTTGSLSTSSAIIDNGTLSVKRSNSVAQGTDFSGSAITGSGAFVQAGSGTTTLNAANTYTGVTSIQGGVLSINSIANVSGGASAIGAPTTTASGTIAIGSGGTTGQLTYTGSATTTNRVINLAGTTGGATIDQSGTGLLKFTSALTATGAGGKTLTLQGSTAGTGELAGAIVDNSGANTTAVVKTGSGAWTLSGTNTYTGPTTVSGGELIVSGSLNGTLIVNVFSGATLASGSTGSIATAASGDVSISGTLAPGDFGAIGTLTLAPGAGGTLSFLSDSNIDFTISGATSDLVSFSTAGDWLNGSGNVTLSLTGITAGDYGNTYTVFHNVSTTGFAVANITGYDSANYVAAFTQVGSDYQLSFTAIPEPSMSMSLFGGVGVLCLLRRRGGKSNA